MFDVAADGSDTDYERRGHLWNNTDDVTQRFRLGLKKTEPTPFRRFQRRRLSSCSGIDQNVLAACIIKINRIAKFTIKRTGLADRQLVRDYLQAENIWAVKMQASSAHAFACATLPAPP